MTCFDLPPSPVYVDNKSAKILATDLVSSSKSRRIAPRYFWTRQVKDMGILTYIDVGTLENVADHFTKVCKVNIQSASSSASSDHRDDPSLVPADLSSACR